MANFTLPRLALHLRLRFQTLDQRHVSTHAIHQLACSSGPLLQSVR